METQDRNLVGQTLRGGTPMKSYKKTILGKVFVTAWNSFESTPEGLILQGNPDTNDDGCIIDIWSVDEDYYFRSKNKEHLQTGVVVEYVRKTVESEKTVEQFTDEELESLLEDKFKKFFALQTLLNSVKSVPVLFRIKRIAENNEKSSKVVAAIEARISELQKEEFKPLPQSIQTEL